MNCTIDPKNRIALVKVDEILINATPARLAAHYARNAQTFLERFNRLILISIMRIICPVVGLWNPSLATRLLHLPLRGMSRDRLDLLGEEYFEYKLKGNLNPERIKEIDHLMATNYRVVLVSGELDHILRPLAQHLQVTNLLSNRFEFRDGRVTGKLLWPVIPPLEGLIEGRGGIEHLDFLLKKYSELHIPRLNQQIQFTTRKYKTPSPPVVDFNNRTIDWQDFSVKKILSGKHILLVGATGFIGKVWLSMLLEDLPNIGRIYLLIRGQGSRSALQRFEKIVSESPVFTVLYNRFGDQLSSLLTERIEVLEGDIGESNFGLEEETAKRLWGKLDLIVNSAGLTDFNPDLRLAMYTNVEGPLQVLAFLRNCDHAGLLHVSTSFVNGRIDGRVNEELLPNYTPIGHNNFDVNQERQIIYDAIKRIHQEAHSKKISAKVSAKILSRQPNLTDPSRLIEKERKRWIRDRGIEFGIERANHWGWPNIYTFTKSLGESVLATEDMPIAVVRPSIVESSTHQPFRGWNEGVNTTAPLSYILSTYFRQLPSNKRKRLDVIPVDLVCRGLTLVSAAIIQRRHEKVYQLCTSATNPADMRRTIELTCLAHRKYYRSLEGLEHWLRARCDTISVSKRRYRHVSLPQWRTVLQALQRLSGLLLLRNESLTRKQRALERVYNVIELYQPFILDNEYFFAADHIRKLGSDLPVDELETFGYYPERIDWYDYWINLHVPALRQWTYPIIEGRRPETGLLARNFKLSPNPATMPSTKGENEIAGNNLAKEKPLQQSQQSRN